MADEGDDMAAAVEKADALKEQAAALRAGGFDLSR